MLKFSNGMRVRLTALLLLLCTTLGAQNLPLVLERSSVRDALKAISAWSGCSFVWESEDMDAEKEVSLRASDLEDALQQVFAEQAVVWTVKGKTIIVSRLPEAAGGAIEQISGVVTDETGHPIEGVVVLNLLTSNGVFTQADGSWSMELVPGVPLSFTCLGYDSLRQPAARDMVVRMKESLLPLSESVVIGYGSIARSRVTGAVSSLEAHDFALRTLPTVGHILQGNVPGMFVQNVSGNPSSIPLITIRGVPSLSGGEPLVLIDGVEGDMARVNPTDVATVSVIKDASSSAIYGAKASFGVILITTKSGASSALRPTVSYTARFGFSSPTTRTDFETRGYDAVYISDLFMKETTGRNYTFYSREDMTELLKRRNDKAENPERPWILTGMRGGRESYIYYCNTDWYHSMYRDLNPVQSHNLSVTGGTDAVRYYISGRFERKQGTFRERAERYDRYNVLTKIDLDLTPNLTLSDKMDFFKSAYDYPGNRSPDNAFGFSSVHGLASFPLQNPDGTWVYRTIFNDFNLANGCHIELGDDAKSNRVDNFQFSNTASLVWKPLKGLALHSDLTYTLDSERDCFRWAGMEYSLYPGEVTREETGRFMNRLEDYVLLSQLSEISLWGSYTRTFRARHHLSLTAGFNAQGYAYKNLYTYADNIGSDSESDYNLKQSDSQGNFRMDILGGQLDHTTAGFFGRINYDYMGRYLLEMSGRYDGSSSFRSGSRWGFFPSASAGWLFTEEPFATGLKRYLDSGKLRFSFGSLGNQQVPDFQYMRTVSKASILYLFQNESSLPVGASLSAPNASDLTWETIRHYDWGLDLTLLQGRLTLTADYFIRSTLNMLTEGEDLPSVYGAPSPLENRADLRSSGYELSLGWQDRFPLGDRTFRYSISAHLSDYTTRITRFGNGAKVLGSHYVGETLGEIWGFRVDGLFKDDAEAQAYTDYAAGGIDQSYLAGGLNGGWRGGDLKFKDLDGDRVISKGGFTVDNPGDLRIIGNRLPRYQAGVTLTAAWGGWDFSAFIQGVGRMNWYPGADNTAFWGPYSRPYGTFYQKDFLDMCWSEDRTDAYFPRTRGMIAMEGTTQLTEPNDRYLQNLGYVRLKNLTVGWSLPSRTARRIRLSALRFYLTAENLAYLSPLRKVTGYVDPEMMYAGGAYGWTYPLQRITTLGVDVTF